MPSPKPSVLSASLLLALALVGCATPGMPVLPEPLREPRQPAQPPVAADAEAPTAEPAPRVRPGPAVESAPVRVFDARRTPLPAGGTPISLALDSVRLSAFIDEVFGNQLGLSLEMEQAVRDRAELVSLRLVQPETPSRVYEIAVEVLKRYGIQVVREEGRLRFTAAAGTGAEPPRMLLGRTLPEVPAGQRPVFMLVPLDVASVASVASQLRGLFADSGLKLTEMFEGNALLLIGSPAVVNAALEAVPLFDRPAFRDRQSLRITPRFLAVEDLARELRSIMVAQGYSVKERAGDPGALTFVPVVAANALIVFGESSEALDAAARWVEEIDQAGEDGEGRSGAYIYEARNTTVESLAPVVGALIGASIDGGGSGAGGARRSSESGPVNDLAAPVAPSSAASGSQGGSSAIAVAGRDGERIVIDTARNLIVFQGSPSRWRQVQSVLQRIDRPARQVLVEVTVAEVTLTGEFNHGVEWAFRNIGVDSAGGPLNLLRGTTGSGGLVYSPISSSGQVRALLNLFATNSRISILSTPRLLVRSGESASIDVGTEVPVITSQATANDLGGITPSILQQVQYRKTGILLRIEPIVHSSQRVDLKLTQEVSEAQETDTSTIASPSIFSRRLESALSLYDGQPMLIGGLISNTRTRGSTEVPGLGRIPVLGNLFSTRNRSEGRTELLVLITPYVIEDESQAGELVDALRRRFDEPESRSLLLPPER
jgi:general secretion pathway protein D